MSQDQSPGCFQTVPAHPKSQDAAQAVARTIGEGLPTKLDEGAELIHRIERLSPDVGWLLIYVGILGAILPGVMGVPLVLAGAAVVTPRGRKRIARWIGRKPPRLVHASITQIERLLDDLDRRYPPIPKIP